MSSVLKRKIRGLTWVGCLHGALVRASLDRWHYTVSTLGTFSFLRLGSTDPPVSPTSGVPYAGSNRNDLEIHAGHPMPRDHSGFFW